MRNVLEVLEGKRFISELSRTELFSIKIHNRILKDEVAEFGWIFPIGAIVYNKQYKYLRCVTGVTGFEYFQDSGGVLNTQRNMLCINTEYSLISNY